MTGYWPDVFAHFGIELVATLMGFCIFKMCPHTWHRWARTVIAIATDFAFAMVCVKVIG